MEAILHPYMILLDKNIGKPGQGSHSCDLERHVNMASYCVLLGMGLLIFIGYSWWTLKMYSNYMQGKMSQLIVVYLFVKSFCFVTLTAFVLAEYIKEGKIGMDDNSEK